MTTTKKATSMSAPAYPLLWQDMSIQLTEFGGKACVQYQLLDLSMVFTPAHPGKKEPRDISRDRIDKQEMKKSKLG